MVETPSIEQIAQLVEEYAIEHGLLMLRITYADESWDELESGVRAFGIDQENHTHLMREGRYER